MPSDYYRLATIERLSGSDYLATIWGWLRLGLAPLFVPLAARIAS